MDLYVCSDSFPKVKQALEDVLHMKQVQALQTQYARLPRKIQVEAFKKVDTSGRVRVFQVVVCSGKAPDMPITSFHSTLVMNFLAHDHLSLAYPKLTIYDKRVVNCTTDLFYVAHTRGIAKYLGRGYALKFPKITSLADTAQGDNNQCAGKYLCPREERDFYDQKCLIIPFGKDGMMDDLDRKWGTKWTFGGFGCGGKCDGFRSSVRVEVKYPYRHV